MLLKPITERTFTHVRVCGSPSRGDPDHVQIRAFCEGGEKMADPEAHFSSLDVCSNRVCGVEGGVTSLSEEELSGLTLDLH